MNLKELRHAYGLNSAEQLAELSGVPVGTIRKYEQGRYKIGLDNAEKIADALGCTIDELAGREAPDGARKLWALVQDLTPAGKMILRHTLKALLQDPDTSYRAQKPRFDYTVIDLGEDNAQQLG